MQAQGGANETAIPDRPDSIRRLLFSTTGSIISGIGRIWLRTPVRNMFRRQAGVVISGLMLVAGGASVALGLKPKLGSAALIAFLAGASPTMHDFWRAEDPGQRMAVLINFSKNLALLG